jgi:hypothetical protein
MALMMMSSVLQSYRHVVFCEKHSNGENVVVVVSGDDENIQPGRL